MWVVAAECCTRPPLCISYISMILEAWAIHRIVT
jgi:hypothetical protein